MFFAIEGPALANRREGDTLTDHIRRWFGLKGKPPGWLLRRLILAVFLIWLPLHFFFGL